MVFSGAGSRLHLRWRREFEVHGGSKESRGLDSLVSLEQLAQNSGVTRGQMDGLARHYRSGWLNEIRFKVRFGMMP